MPGKPAVARQSQMQKAGTILATGVGLVFVGVIGWYVLHAGKASAPPVQAPAGPKKPSDSLLGDGEPGQLQVMEGERVHIDMMDKKNPTRQTGQIQFDSLEPLEAHHYEAAKPEAWMFLADGRSLHITAASGKLYMPDRTKEPESGTLTGGVQAELYEGREDGAKAVAGKDEPSLTFKTQTLAFDSTLGRLSTKDRVSIVSNVADFSGTGMDLLFNQVKQRLEKCEIGPGENSAVFHAGAKSPKRAKPGKPETVAAAKPSGQGAAAGAPAAANGAAAKSKGPIETLYRVDFDQAVNLSQATRGLTADKLQIWARLVGGDLPDGAIAPVRGQQAAESSAAGSGRAPAVNTNAAAERGDKPRASEPAPSAPGVGRDITLHWTGPCVIVPLDEAPAELKTEHLAARFSAKQAVGLSDTEHGMTGRAGTIEYGATSGKLLLAGADAGRPWLTWANAGTVETDRIEGDLVHGLIHIPVAGTLGQAKRDTKISWGRQADISLLVRDGAVVGELKQATFEGRISMADKSARIEGESARADFVRAGEQPNILSRLIVNENALAVSERSGRLEAGTLDVEFALPGPGEKAGDPQPRVVTATDHVVVAQKDSRMTADWLEATLGRTPSGQTDVSSAHAKGSVQFSRESDGITAAAGEMRADLGWEQRLTAAGSLIRRQTIDLFGGNVLIKRGQTSTLAARQVRLDGIGHAAEVFGEGTFDHNDPAKNAVISAKWLSGMTFNDDRGLLTAVGDAHVVSTPDPMTKDTIDAGRIEVGLTPRGKDDAGADVKRDVLWAHAIGSVLERDGGVNATVVAEKFVADSGSAEGRKREQLQYLEGPRINTDNAAGTLDVPGAGKLVIVDHSEAEKPAQPSDLAPGGMQGDALFTWANALHMDRTSGRADMDGSVRLTHRSLKDRQITNLDCGHLTAVARTRGNALDTQSGGLVSATASGAVYATVGAEAVPGQNRPVRKELGADLVEYDAVKRTLDSTASSGGLVTIFDPAKGSPISAARLFWDLASDRIEIKDLKPIVAPR